MREGNKIYNDGYLIWPCPEQPLCWIKWHLFFIIMWCASFDVSCSLFLNGIVSLISIKICRKYTQSPILLDIWFIVFQTIYSPEIFCERSYYLTNDLKLQLWCVRFLTKPFKRFSFLYVEGRELELRSDLGIVAKGI